MPHAPWHRPGDTDPVVGPPPGGTGRGDGGQDGGGGSGGGGGSSSGQTPSEQINAIILSYQYGGISYDEAAAAIAAVFTSIGFDPAVADGMARGELGDRPKDEEPSDGDESPSVNPPPGSGSGGSGGGTGSGGSGGTKPPIVLQLGPDADKNVRTATKAFGAGEISYDELFQLVRGEFLALYEDGHKTTPAQDMAIATRVRESVGSLFTNDELVSFYGDGRLGYKQAGMLISSRMGWTEDEAFQLLDDFDSGQKPGAKEKIDREDELSASLGGIGQLFNEFISNSDLRFGTPTARSLLDKKKDPFAADFTLDTVLGIAQGTVPLAQSGFLQPSFTEFLGTKDLAGDGPDYASMLNRLNKIAPLFTNEQENVWQDERRAVIEGIDPALIQNLVAQTSLMGVNPMFRNIAMQLLADQFNIFASSNAGAAGVSLLDEFIDQGLNFFNS